MDMPEWLREHYKRRLAERSRPTIFTKVAAISKIREQPFYGDDSWYQEEKAFFSTIKWKTYA